MREKGGTTRCIVGCWGRFQPSPGHRDGFRRGHVRRVYNCSDWSPRAWANVCKVSLRDTDAESWRQLLPGERHSHRNNLCGAVGARSPQYRQEELYRGSRRPCKDLRVS